MELSCLCDTIIESRSLCDKRATLIGLSGIDASGKGYIASELQSQLTKAGLQTALIGVDGWLNLPGVRFRSPKLTVSPNDGEHFYHNALRLDEMFSSLILPLKQNRRVDLTMDFAEETATAYRPHGFEFSGIDIILLEGIFIFKKAYVDLFDLRLWIDCGFETALARAIARSQEGLSREDTIRAYERIYFPAQRIHFELDHPRSSAHILFPNDR